MKFNLTRNQMQILIANDPSFLDTVLDTLEGANPVDTKAREYAKMFGTNKIGAIKELRLWAALPENRYDVGRSGYETYNGTIGLAAAKNLIEKYLK